MGLVLWLSWVDDCLIAGKKEQVVEAKQQMMSNFDCDEIGELKEYVGCKVEHNHEEGFIKLTQPVLLQSFEDEFDLPEGKLPKLPATPEQVLQQGDKKDNVRPKEQSIY